MGFIVFTTITGMWFVRLPVAAFSIVMESDTRFDWLWSRVWLGHTNEPPAPWRHRRENGGRLAI
jgi:hypothetical protein